MEIKVNNFKNYKKPKKNTIFRIKIRISIENISLIALAIRVLQEVKSLDIYHSIIITSSSSITDTAGPLN